MTKEELIAKLSELTDSDLDKAGLQKKSSIDSASDAGKLQIKNLREELELQRQIAIAQDDTQKAYNKTLELGRIRIDQMMKEGETALNRKNMTDEMKNILNEIGATQEEYINGEITLEQIKVRINQNIKIANNEGEKYRKNFESIATHLGMSSKGVAGMLNTAVSYSQELNEKTEDGNELSKAALERQKQLAEAFRSTFNITNLAAAALTAYIETTIKNITLLDTALTSFAAATGAGREYADVIETSRANNIKFNVSAAETAKSTQALFEGFIGFGSAGKAAQTELAGFTAQLGKFGVDGQTAVGILNFFSTNLGKSFEESERLTKQLAMMGPKIGISTAKMTKDFQSALPTLAVYGDKAIDVFQGIAGAARLAGVETSKMLDLANKFDTFSSSAETAGKLNAILGTQISAQEMLLATEDERIEMLIRSTQATGVAFDQLGRFEQKAIAAAAGISDLSEAQRIFGMDLAEFQRQQATLDKSAKIQEDFNQALKDMIPIKEKFMALFARFAPVVSDFLEGAHTVLNFIGEVLDYFEPETLRNIGMAAAGLTSVVLAVKAYGAVKGIFTAFSAGLSLIAPAGAAAEQGLAATGRGLGSFFAALSKGVFGIAIATVAIGGLMLAYSAIRKQYAKEEEAKARQVEGNVALAESFKEIGGSLGELAMSTFEKPIAGLQAMAQALGQFQNVDVDARATLTNLALISAGKAADSAQNAKIVAAGVSTISNNISNSFAPSLVLEIDGEQFKAKVRQEVVSTLSANN